MENSPQIVQKGVRIVSLNCFLIPYLLTFRNTESANSRLNQSERAKRIGSFVASKDLVILQEVWGSQLNLLQQSIQKSHQILPGSESYKDTVYGYQYVSNLLDSVNYWWNRTGGLWCAHRNNLPLVFHARHTFTISETSSQKGVQAMLVDMNAFWPNKYLLIFNTHLDPRHVENKRKQFQEIHDFMGEVLKKIKESDKNISLANCGVMLMGDFNTKSTTGEYTHLVTLFGMRDLYKEHMIKTGETEKPTFGCGENSLICEPKSHERRIDYIFALDSYKYNENSNMKGEEVKFLPLQSEDFEIATQRQGEELSDHWPLLCTVKPRDD